MLLSRDPSNFPELTTLDHEIDYFECLVVVVLFDQGAVATGESDQDFFYSRMYIYTPRCICIIYCWLGTERGIIYKKGKPYTGEREGCGGQ